MNDVAVWECYYPWPSPWPSLIKSVTSMTFASCNYSPASSVHSVHQAVVLDVSNTTKHLGDSCTQLRSCTWSWLHLVELFLNNVPLKFYRVYVRGSSWVRQQIDFVVSQTCQGSLSSMTPYIILLEQKARVPLEKWDHKGHQDLYDVSLCVTIFPRPGPMLWKIKGPTG